MAKKGKATSTARGGKIPAKTARSADRRRNTDQQGRQGNTRQNTTNQGYQQDR
jgi:hypothetical protein